ncbi:hypothetical protein SAMN02982917_0510 [Azospirillum oryzae]|uniref:Uncharacterized protein n=2 Tax=Azospirillum oryzae TaxID=286727 RepID=A0A1X7HSJ7_9PROT|nr:hypothetical protein SAMN02982917_0510 [Azospirillum oryzae]
MEWKQSGAGGVVYGVGEVGSVASPRSVLSGVQPMKAFLAALVAILVLAGGAWAILPSLFARSADETFASSGARVGEEASIEHRNFSGRPQADRQE